VIDHGFSYSVEFNGTYPVTSQDANVLALFATTTYMVTFWGWLFFNCRYRTESGESPKMIGIVFKQMLTFENAVLYGLILYTLCSSNSMVFYIAYPTYYYAISVVGFQSRRAKFLMSSGLWVVFWIQVILTPVVVPWLVAIRIIMASVVMSHNAFHIMYTIDLEQHNVCSLLVDSIIQWALVSAVFAMARTIG
jgi:hypothetical protein